MTATVPSRPVALELNGLIRDDARQLMERLITHVRDGTTDEATDQKLQPAASYRDPALFKRELQAVHRSVPLPLALTCELADPGNYKAMEVAGVPVILSRDEAGRVHALVNACRHRGAELVSDGHGTTRRFICPYHSWTYDLSGCLRGVNAEQTFGPVDRAAMGLLSLPVQERAGLVFVSLDPARPVDLDTWLGDELLARLESLELDSAYFHSSTWLDGPNWKVAVDGYLESYHFASLHRTTVFRTNLSNIATFDAFGVHQRNCWALRSIDPDRSFDEHDPRSSVGLQYSLFPGLAIVGGWRGKIAVSIVLPGRTVDSSRTQQVVLLRNEPADDAERQAADELRDWFSDIISSEDYATGYGVQRGLGALGDTDFVLGRNEPGVQHFHRTVERLLAASPDPT